ncbi:MAG: serine/threonine protein kinase [Planctomycetes bacterium]|nr:serine/threonine protein kinase [Planctomycetota bacterium]
MWSVSVLKRDALGRVELLARGGAADGERLVRRVASGGALPLSRRIARALARREERALAALLGLDGVPRLVNAADLPPPVGRDGEGVLVRTYIDGAPLHRCERLPLDFFERLEELVRELHARGVAHNDLHKEQNIVVGRDGRPALIDFQLASVHALRTRGLASRASDDLRHVAKHRRRYLRFARVVDVAPSEELLADPPRPPRRRGLALVWRKTAKPLYNVLTRRVLRRRDGEERRDVSDVWPVWVAAIGPRAP